MTRANGVESGRRPDTPWLSVVRYTLLTSKPGPAYFNEHMLSSELIVQLSEQHVATVPVCEFFFFKKGTHRACWFLCLNKVYPNLRKKGCFPVGLLTLSRPHLVLPKSD